MAHFLVFADQPNKRRSDGLNALVVEAADAASAPAAARALVGGSATTFDNFAVTEIAPGVQFALQGNGVVGQPGNSLGLPTVDRGGNVPLAAL
ncbi:hypothetical protein [Microbulbifer hydrolyticus]|uniref:Uncharacterized protein n=1 Tax=Microbulbifer hydrolyticus TaxID=48074 RepID=A0A6P1THC2_9GAMM|nr:hypothetical protein [Microbulbifer hydrolyticus]MBB5212612.1 hypothetical protein [Microbulbifer hydrolyticus]QHQ40222.1 hypothetical protein GTQ55_15370 [Microbulbifer hydrolyticus]